MVDTKSAYSVLHPKIQKWIYSQGWTHLNPAQVESIHTILGTANDLIVSAPTASGKTEAAFLPLISDLLSEDNPSGSIIVYVSPLKALINDQWQRLDSLCKEVDIQIIPWHGDISASIKGRVTQSLKTVILITPESLEAMLINRPQLARSLSRKISAFVLDEFHSFVGAHRGEQLLSLLYRYTRLANKHIRRIALSATLGDKELVAKLLAPHRPKNVKHIQATEEGQSIRLILRGYLPPEIDVQEETNQEELENNKERPDFYSHVSNEIYKFSKSTNLIFPNDRASAELIVDYGNELCEQNSNKKCFWVHHGMLSKEVREDVEQKARNGSEAMSIACTTTLEMGIDIGAVDTVFQIGAAHSVSSLRQRLGRSGRRGKAPVLRAFVQEPPIDSPASQSNYAYMFRESLLRSMACLDLISSNWYEPPKIEGISLSIAAHQILSSLAQTGGLSAGQLWQVLHASDAFSYSSQDFIEILRSLGEKDLIIQLEGGMLTLSERGEKLTHSMDFYTVFDTEREFSILSSGNLIAKIPITSLIAVDDYMLLAGRRWIVKSINESSKSINVSPTNVRGKTPVNKAKLDIHTRIRKKMLDIIQSNDIPGYLDDQAIEFLTEARDKYQSLDLCKLPILGSRDGLVTWFPWTGSTTIRGIKVLLTSLTDEVPQIGRKEVSITTNCSSIIQAQAYLRDISPDDVKNQMLTFFTSTSHLAITPSSGKWSWLLTDKLRCIDYFEREINIPEAIDELLSFTPPPFRNQKDADNTAETQVESPL